MVVVVAKARTQMPVLVVSLAAPLGYFSVLSRFIWRMLLIV